MLLRIFDKVLALLEKYIPSFLAGLYLGKQRAQKRITGLKIDLFRARHKLEKAKSRAKRIAANSDISADDVRDQIVSEAKRSLRTQTRDD